MLAAFGAEVIRIEDPVTKGCGTSSASSVVPLPTATAVLTAVRFNNDNVEKLGITLNLRTERGKELLAESWRAVERRHRELRRRGDERLGFGYDLRLKELRPDVVYVSNCGFGDSGPYWSFKSWADREAVSGLTHTSGLPQQEPAGWGYSYMDHSGGHFMASLCWPRLYYQRRTGEGQWVDVACIEAGIASTGPAALRRHRQRARRAGRGRRVLQPQHLAGDGASRHLPVP